MHFVIGGAFNGKRAWVKKLYRVNEHDQWLSAYQNNPLPTELHEIDQDLLILEGLETWLKELVLEFGADKSRYIWNRCLTNWITWEEAGVNRKLVVIGTDITKGIVPLEKENRLWRDVTGWAYQDCVKMSQKVDIIWYGINQSIKKGEKENENLHTNW